MEVRKGYPKEWSAYIKLVTHADPSNFKFADNQGDINRFAARFRAANQFEGITLKGYGEDTTDGYSALCQVMFTWSAFETFEKIAKLNKSDLGRELEHFEAIEVLNKIRAIDKKNRFYKFIHERVNPTHRRELENYFNEDSCNSLSSFCNSSYFCSWLAFTSCESSRSTSS